ncbi:MAG: hypothetical protein ABIK53_01780 [bacterium]
MKTRYAPVDNGYEIIGSQEIFNRTLYGGHANDNLPERYFTFAGDQPLIMGAITDWRKDSTGPQAKCGVFMVGVALTPGLCAPPYYVTKGESLGEYSSQWLHKAEGTISTFRNGWMEHKVQPFSPWFPHVKAFVEVLPLMPEDGFLVHLRIKADQRVILCMGFGGITDFLGLLEFPAVTARNFKPEDCCGNIITCGTNRALVQGKNGDSADSSMWIGTNFPMEVSIGDAKQVQDGKSPGAFLEEKPVSGDTPIVRISCPISQGKTLDGVIVVIRNEKEKKLDYWLSKNDSVADLKHKICQKQSAIEVHTPDAMLDLTIPPTAIALDASWHRNAFYHGATSYHSPYLGWRNSYGPTTIGWHDRVETCFRTHASGQVNEAEGPEKIWYDGNPQPGYRNGGTQYHWLKNSTGFIPFLLGKHTFKYNMQEVAIDMFIHHLEWTGKIALARDMFDVVERVLDWEARILDPDRDGLYQNCLNTWISDSHSYNGGGCAQSSAYNFRANYIMGKIAKKLGLDHKVFMSRANKIFKALQNTLWLPSRGIMAEYIDTVGKKLIHPSPELATIYHSIESGAVDAFQAYQMLRFTETDLRNEQTLPRKGRLVWSSNWYPQSYSSCGLYTAENLHLAWSYFQNGWAEKGMEILGAVVDAYFMGRNPGMAAHCMTGTGHSEQSHDFTDVSSMYLRVIVEGLFGVRFHLLDDRIEVAPNLPADWDHASLKVKDISINYSRSGRSESLEIWCEQPAARVLKLPMRSTCIESVLVNGEPVKYRVEPEINHCSIVVETSYIGHLHLCITHGGGENLPVLELSKKVHKGDWLQIKITKGEILDYKDPSNAVSDVCVHNSILCAKVIGSTGAHTVFIHAKIGHWSAWLTADFLVVQKPKLKRIIPCREFHSVNISKYFNISLTEIHSIKYLNPRPSGYSIGVGVNGRSGWDWNQAGRNTIVIEDNVFRQCKGTFRTPSGINFKTPPTGPNAACVSIWDNFPDKICIPISGKAAELAVFFIGVTNPMQSRVENGHFKVEYTDGTLQKTSLVNPVNFDDWLVAAVQQGNETVYFSDYNHGMVQRLILDPMKKLKSFSVEAVANEVIIGILGLSFGEKS